MLRTMAIVALVCFAGCTSLTRHVDQPVGDLAQAPIQNEHYYAVLDLLGPPAQITETPDGFAFLYESYIVRDRQIGISPDTGNAWSLIRFSRGRVSLEREILVVSFDETGHARAAGVYAGKENIGASFVIQPIFGVSPSTDTSYLNAPPVQQSWGRESLRRLPQTLNREQDLRTGRAGFQLIGTPTGAGQLSLETPNSGRQRRIDR
jgi:hypothetical protein